MTDEQTVAHKFMHVVWDDTFKACRAAQTRIKLTLDVPQPTFLNPKAPARHLPKTIMKMSNFGNPKYPTVRRFGPLRVMLVANCEEIPGCQTGLQLERFARDDSGQVSSIIKP